VGDNTPDTPFSAPGGLWTFSFNLENNPIHSNPTNEITNFSYELNGVEVSNTVFSPFVTAEFFTADKAGMFDLSFSNGDVVSLYGADIGSTLTFAPRVDVVAAGMQMLPATGLGTVIVRVSTGSVGVTGFGGGAVPEPSTRVMMALGFAGLAFLGYRAARKA
jgi:PEP-CTERM motif